MAMSEAKLKGVRAELGDTLGIGAATVVIGAEVLEQKLDRLEITMTAGQVRDVLVKQKQKVTEPSFNLKPRLCQRTTSPAQGWRRSLATTRFCSTTTAFISLKPWSHRMLERRLAKM